MRCREVENLLPDYSAEALPRQQIARVGEHLAGCDGCRQAWARLQSAIRLVENLGATSPPPGLWHGVYQRIQAGEEGATGRPGVRRRTLPIWRWWTWPVRTATAAGAAAVLAVGVWLSYGGGRSLDRIPIDHPTATTAALTDPEMVAALQQHTLASTGQIFADRAGLESVVQLMRQKREERVR
jgi:Putative zinc-finger